MDLGNPSTSAWVKGAGWSGSQRITDTQRGLLRGKTTKEGGEGMQFTVPENFVFHSVVCNDAVLTVPGSWDLNTKLQGPS